jgi:dynein heavy chain
MLGTEGHAKEIFKLNSKGLLHCYSIVLLQEQERYNKLIRVISDSLEMLIKAIQGLVLMSPELDQMYTSLLQNQVPANWESVAYSSLKTLASWYQDLHKRVRFMRAWMTHGHPSAFWLSGFFFPHGFVTGVLQAYARKHLKAIDFLKFKFDFLNLEEQKRRRLTEKEKKAMEAARSSDAKKHTNSQYSQQGAIDEELLIEAPEDGVYVYGLFLESAVWNKKRQCITEQRPGVIISPMPIVHFLPFEVKHKAVK